MQYNPVVKFPVFPSPVLGVLKKEAHGALHQLLRRELVQLNPGQQRIPFAAAITVVVSVWALKAEICLMSCSRCLLFHRSLPHHPYMTLTISADHKLYYLVIPPDSLKLMQSILLPCVSALKKTVSILPGPIGSIEKGLGKTWNQNTTA